MIQGLFFTFCPPPSFSDHMTFHMTHHLTHHLTYHLTYHLTHHQTSHLTLNPKYWFPYCPPDWDTFPLSAWLRHFPIVHLTRIPFYCSMSLAHLSIVLCHWLTFLLFYIIDPPFYWLTYLLFYVINPHFLVAHILGSIFSTGTCLYINPLYFLELGLKPDLVFNPRLVASTALLWRVSLYPWVTSKSPLKLSLPLFAL